LYIVEKIILPKHRNYKPMLSETPSLHNG